jgi:hypothetical protein
MKLNYFLSFCLLLILASCSQQKFAFRHTVHVKNNQPTLEVTRQKQNVAVMSAHNISLPNITRSQPQKMELSAVKEITRAITINKPTTLHTDTLKKKYKFDTEVATPTDERNGNNSAFIGDNSQYDKAAITGFVLGILGWLYLLTSIPGLIYSIKGLKSKRYYGLALTGLILSSIFALFLVLILIIMISFLSA